MDRYAKKLLESFEESPPKNKEIIFSKNLTLCKMFFGETLQKWKRNLNNSKFKKKVNKTETKIKQKCLWDRNKSEKLAVGQITLRIKPTLQRI